jgi:hypothetical protein
MMWEGAVGLDDRGTEGGLAFRGSRKAVLLPHLRYVAKAINDVIFVNLAPERGKIKVYEERKGSLHRWSRNTRGQVVPVP